MMARYTYLLMVGGSRSGKTFIGVRNIILRAIKAPSRHLILRLRFKHIKDSVWSQTIPKVLKLCFPQLKEGTHYKLNKSDYYLKLIDNGSEIWIGGLDEAERTEKILGTEYSTLYFNESSQLDYGNIEDALTRLAEMSGLNLLGLFDCNPPTRKHWTARMFIDLQHPKTLKPLSPEKYGYIFMNPDDNRENLPSEYFNILDGLEKKKRDRFLLGKFQQDIEGTLWEQSQIDKTKIYSQEEIADFPRMLTAIAVDPTISEDTGTNDECGIIVGSKDTRRRDKTGNTIIEHDASGHYTPDQWAKIVTKLYYKYNANHVIAEGNAGGSLVRNIIHKYDSTIPVITVHASKGKFARAEPASVLYEQGKVLHVPTLEALEEEMTSFVFHEAKFSPGRIDALVWLLSFFYSLSGLNKKYRFMSV